MTQLSDFWRGRRVLVTGHTGFKGSWLCLWLSHLGARTWGLALPPPSDPSLFRLAAVEGVVTSVVADVRDPAKLQSVMDSAAPEVVFHLAAQSLVRPSYEDPIGTYSTNVMGTANVLEAVRRTPSVASVVVVTSDKCYEIPEDRTQPFAEDDSMGGYDPYSSSKGCAELVTAAYRRSFFGAPDTGGRRVGVASVRAGNVIGGGDWAKDRLIPDMMNAFLDGRHVGIRNPVAVRPWQHVLEPLGAYLQLGERLARGELALAEGWNIGPQAGDAWPVSRIADHLTSLWGGGAEWKSEAEADAPHEARLLSLCTDKARERLGYQPRLDLPTSLQWVVEWYRGYGRGTDPAALTVDQIDRFQHLAP